MGVQVKAWKGACWIFVNHKGQRKAKRVGTGKEGHRVAIAVAEKFQARLVLGDLSLLEAAKPQEITLREYTEQWLATDVPLRQKPGTVETYRGVLRNHWLPELGTLTLSAITRQLIKTIIQRKLMAGMQANTARSMFGVLRTCLNVAVEEARIIANPTARVGKFIARSRTEVEIFTPEELTRLLQTTAEEIPKAYSLVLTLA
jgi:integrase